MAQEVHAFVRERLARLFGPDGARIRVQYGGSVKPDNVFGLMAEQDIDGALVGGASLDPRSFAQIARFERAGEQS
jgi:triosephosphate isomerase